MRLRLQRTTRPHRAIVLTDTPNPRCPHCDGYGGHPHYTDHSGQWDDTVWESCPCWDESRHWILLRLPGPRHRSLSTPWTGKPPF